MTDEATAREAAQTDPERAGAPHPLDKRLRNLAAVSSVAFAIGCVTFFGYALFQVANREVAGQTVPNDFSVMWAAARLALEGRPLAAFDLETLNGVRNLPPWTGEAGYRMSWLYPAHLLALVMPFGLLPFMPAWLLFSALGVLFFALAVRAVNPVPAAVALTVASPAVLICLMHGQNTLYIGALLVAFLANLRDNRKMLAGFLLGLLTVKPQFGPLLPIVVIMIGRWNVIFAAVATCAAIFALSLAWVGMDYWIAFRTGIGGTDELITDGWLPRHLMVTWYAFALDRGAPLTQAKAVQLGIAILIAIAVALVWRRRDLPFEVKAAVLTIGIPIVTPYAYFYDLVLTVIGAGLLLATPVMCRAPVLSAVAALWALPALGHFLHEVGVERAFAMIGAPVLTLSLAIVVASALGLPRQGIADDARREAA